MLTIKKDGHIVIIASSTDYQPAFETEKEKPKTLYVYTTEKERGLLDG